MKTDGAWLSIEIISILLTYVFAMLCLLGFLFGFASPYVILEGALIAVAWWIVSLLIRNYRYKTFHPPDGIDRENSKSK